MASGYQQIGTVSFGQPGVFTSFLSEYVDGFSMSRSFKVGFSGDLIFRKFQHHWSIPIKDARRIRDSALITDESSPYVLFKGTAENVSTSFLSRAQYRMSGTLVEIEEDGGHGMDNYLKHFEVIGKDEAKYDVEGEGGDE
jgi:hypothetical protein